MKKCYIIKLSHNCSFKTILENGEDANRLAKDWVANQNRGEAKSDRLILKGVKAISEKEYGESLLWWGTLKFNFLIQGKR